ncbi:MAG TPA: PEP/pyruvate-binding domain-containing protein, partial [Kofleriaceae bacterium]|nr:PEP/pyruvate-binding domain-containing protein [Kofleriaceae bacterium]
MTRSKAHRHGREPSFHKLHGLMPFMVREILLCSSAYDAFLLEEDGRLEERLFSAYDALSLSLAPRITHATTAAESLELLAGRHFDLVITVVRLQDTDAADLSRRIHALDPRLPIVLLAFDEADPHSLPGGVLPSGIDRVFLWTGDARILIAAIKLVEDARNADHDSQSAGVPIILVVEDSPRRYSSFLALLYAELMAQSQSLIAEGLNAIHRLMRMRARPKIVLATSYEEALALYHRHEDHLLAVLSDVRFPRAGREDPEAGLALVRTIHAAHPELPLLLQSADGGFEKPAAELGAWNVSKNSPTLLAQIRRFLKEALGFGDFVFRKPDGTEVGRAHDLYELERLLRKVPPDSLEFHARANHFSLWLKARTMFSLAREVRPRTAGEFEDIEAIRRYLLDVLHRELSQEEEGLIADFVPTAAPGRRFVRLGRGSIGGKGRGIAFANSFLVQHGFDAFEELDIRIPRTLAIAVDEFDRFLERSNMNRDELIGRDDPALIRRFLAGELHPELRTHLVHALETFTGPLAVRSSSLLEDSRFQPFAGIYATYMLP